MHKKIFSQKIIEWYRSHHRPLPWRETRDPYKIWVSEIILQQTRISQGYPYYLKFVERFPDVETLARAREQEVLRLWQGLGYYTRARNLHRCAKIIVRQLNGRFPCNFVELQKLPGVGPYTAAAIASISFGEQVPVVDGNVYRVLARVFGIDKDIASYASRSYFFSKAKELIPQEYPDEFNQAMMEFGALQCLPQNPKCDECIFNKSCLACARGQQSVLPVKSKNVKSRKRFIDYWVIRQNKKLAMKRREGEDIWKGLYDFYSEETSSMVTSGKSFTKKGALRKIGTEIHIGDPSPVYKHILTHQTLFARFTPIEIIAQSPVSSDFFSQGLRFYGAGEINKLPKPILVSRYLSDIGFL